jgi:hypothetical protein
MCLGEAGLDTIEASERESLRAAAGDAFPSHRFGVHANADGISWIVLEPSATRADLLRFTICRIAPCLMVMAEDASGRRQICSTDGVGNAMAFARQATDQAVLAAMNAHPAHDVLQ